MGAGNIQRGIYARITMKYIDLDFLHDNADLFSQSFNAKEPFRYVYFDGILKPEAAELIHSQYPTPSQDTWNKTNYIQQRNKLQKSTFLSNSLFDEVFKELNSQKVRQWLEKVTGISNLEADNQLFGGGLHQSMNGAFLNVHVDFNIHPTTKYYRRLNLLIYLNKDWKEEYNGAVEFWDMEANQRLAMIYPLFNRCVIFETNEISFHGHPIPLNTPPGVTRKSLAVYYYTKNPPENLNAVNEHNTLFRNTEGLSGQWKKLVSAIKTLKERVLKQ